jgi:alpha-tubulin suppressor-like RCC1 family protein
MIRRLAAGAAAMTALALPFLPAAGASAAGGQHGTSPVRPAAASGGALTAWGDNSAGELGNGGNGLFDTTPVAVSLPVSTQVIQARAGCLHAVALTSTGGVLAWGNNQFGQLGNGTNTDSSTPVPVNLPVGTTVKAVRAGCFFSLALTTSGQVLAWGNNEFGQLGNGNSGDSSTPVPVSLPPGTTVKAISAGGDHALALTSTGRVLAWGHNQFGELGNNTTTDSNTPVRVARPPGVSVTALAAGDQYSMALTSGGQVLAWGENDSGQLGDGTTVERNLPVQVKLPSGTKVKGLFGGAFHAVALTTTGQVLAWGDNEFGQLGDGTTTARHRPVAVKLAAGTTVTAVSAGDAHSLALTSTGNVLAWGLNASGELGNGTTTDSSLPVRVKLPAGTVPTSLGAGPTAQFSLSIVPSPPT